MHTRCLIGLFSLFSCGSLFAAPAAYAAQNDAAVYQIVSVQSGQGLDIVGRSTDNGAQLQQWPYGGGANQQFKLVQGTGGGVGIVSVGSGKALDVPYGSGQQGLIVQQWDFWSGPMQSWRLVAQSDGNYQVVNVATGQCLDLPGGTGKAGTRIQQWGCWGGANQRWRFVQVQGPTPTKPSPQSAPAAIDFQAPGNAAYKLADYGAPLQANKGALLRALDTAGANPSEQTLIVGMAMIETTLMDISQRDSHKDGTPSANVSILNMNIDMVTMLGYTGSDNGASLNDPNNLPLAVSYLLKGLRGWGVARTLNFHRGGRTAFEDGVSYGAAEYRNAVATTYQQIVNDPRLLRDSRRVEIEVPPV